MAPSSSYPTKTRSALVRYGLAVLSVAIMLVLGLVLQHFNFREVAGVASRARPGSRPRSPPRDLDFRGRAPARFGYAREGGPIPRSEVGA